MGKKNGIGKLTFIDGAIYEGYLNYIYLGNFIDNEIDGEGSYFWPDGRVYQGQWKENKMHGEGSLKWPDGRCY